MPEELPNNTKADLAVALAHGITPTAWGRARGVPKPTACRWAREPEIRKEVAACRRRTLDRAIGMMVKLAPSTVSKIAVIGAEAPSDSVRLTALRTIFKDMMAVSKYSGLEGRLTEVEERLDARDRIADHAV
jgi:hypothetical protein